MTAARARRPVAAIVVAAIAVLGVASAASAQDGVELFDASTGYDHVNQPPPGALSSADWCFAFTDRSLAGQTVEVQAQGPTGPVSGSGVVADNGTVKVRVGITEGGLYTVTSLTAGGTTVDAASVASIDVVFDPAEIDCLDSLTAAPPTTTTTAPATTSTSTSTTSTTTSTTSTAPPATTESPTTTAAVEPPSDDAGGGGPWPLLLTAGIGLLLLGLAVAFLPDILLTTQDRCDRERKAVEAAKAKLATSKAAFDKIVAELRALSKESDELSAGSGSARRMSPQQRQMRQNELMREERRLLQRRGVAQIDVETDTGLLRKAESALAACEKRPPSPGGGTTSGPAPPTGPGTAPPPEEPVDTTSEKDENTESICCESKNWIGWNAYGGLQGGVLGYETGTIVMFCADDFSKVGVFKWRGLRLGLGAGFEISSGPVFVSDDAVHPRQLTLPLKKLLGGWNGDISLGLGWSKFLKGGMKAVAAGSTILTVLRSGEKAAKAAMTARKARRAAKAGDAAKAAAEQAEHTDELIKSALEGVTEAAAKGAVSTMQNDGERAQIPVGVGAQLGGWKLILVKVEMVGWYGCETCDPELHYTPPTAK